MKADPYNPNRVSDYTKITEDWIKNPKSMSPDKFYSILSKLKEMKWNESKFKSFMKQHAESFEKEKIEDNDPIFSDFQSEEIKKKCGKAEYVYYIGFDGDNQWYYCKEKNLIIVTDYKRVYFDFDIFDFED